MAKEKVVKKRNKWLVPGIIAVIVLIFIMWFAGSYNGLVSVDENVNEKWGNVQTAYQRRADFIPNLVATVDASAEFEQETLAKVTGLRAGIVNAQSPEDLDLLGKEINTAINLAFEAYPDIKTTAAFRDLQVQLEGTENRIKTERDIYNKAVKDNNVKVRRFPTNIVAGMFGFETKESFSADTGAENTPDVGELFN